MKAVRIPILLTILQLLLVVCSTDDEPEIDKECNIDITTIDFSFGIDYNNLDKYLVPGGGNGLKRMICCNFTFILNPCLHGSECI